MTNSKPVWAVIPASGVGRRMHSERPKQYLSFGGKTIIEHTLDRLLNCPHIHGAILVLQADDAYWPELNYQAVKPLYLATGGKRRQDSVINGLSVLNDRFKHAYALVHDAVRPLVSDQDLNHLIASLNHSECGAILATPLFDTIKRQNKASKIQKTIDRQGLWRALTPQLFKAEILQQALQQARINRQIMTDESVAMEALGYQPLLVEGSAENIKITRPDDLRLAQLIWQSRQNQ